MLEESTLYIGEPNDVYLDELRDASVSPAVYLNDLEGGTFVVTDSAVYGTGNVIGETHDLTYVASSAGKYKGTWPDDEALAMLEGETYYVWLLMPDVTLRRLERTAAYRDKC